MWERYFDNAASTPLDPRVLKAMLPYLGDGFGNAHSLHSLGRRSHEAVENARAEVAAAIGAEDPAQIYFTSGASESNSWVLRAFSKVHVSPFEHSSIRNFGFPTLQNNGYSLTSPPGDVDLSSVMAVNNETGAILSTAGLHSLGAKLHSDITQAAAKLKVDLEPLDFASFSAHKFYGPNGVGALYVRETPPAPLIVGEQENGHRGGTLNVAGIVGMGLAATLAAAERSGDSAQTAQNRSTLLDCLGKISEMQINEADDSSPYILSLSFSGLTGESLVLESDAAGFAISSGAACSSLSTEPSHVLSALEVPPDLIAGTIRVSFGKYNTVDATAELGKVLAIAVDRLRSLSVRG
jgi:cysteine desulfurase